MKTFIVLNCFLLPLIVGCSSTYSVSANGTPEAECSFQEVDQEVREREAEIAFFNDETITASSVTVSRDSVSWTDLQSGKVSSGSVGNVKSITTANNFLGAVEGVGFGLIAGIVFGAGIGIISSDRGEIDHNTGIKKKDVGLIVGGILGGLTGIAAGGAMGGVMGHRYIYEFPRPKTRRTVKDIYR